MVSGTKPALRCLLCCLMAGCASTNTPDNAQIQRIDYLQESVVTLRQKVDNLEREYLGDKLCHKNRAEIAGFVAAVQRGAPGACTPMKMEEALPFLSSQPVGFVYLDPRTGLSSLRNARKSFIRDDLLHENHLHEWTRVLVLVQPYSQTSTAAHESFAVAKALSDQILSDLPAVIRKKEALLGPYLLPCNLRSEAALLKLYGGPQFTPTQRYKLTETVPGEPNPKQLRIRVWVFRIDCP